MLLDKAQVVDINDVVTILLVGGEEIVGKLIERTSESVSLAKPIRVVLEPIHQGQVGVSVLPVLGSVSEMSSVQIPFSAMAIRPLKTGEDLRRKYLEITSGLVTPSRDQTLNS